MKKCHFSITIFEVDLWQMSNFREVPGFSMLYVFAKNEKQAICLKNYPPP